MLDRYIHSNLVYYTHNGDDEPYDRNSYVFSKLFKFCAIKTVVKCILLYSYIRDFSRRFDINFFILHSKTYIKENVGLTETYNNNNNNNNNKFVYRDTTNVEPEMYDCTSNNWSHCNSNEKFKEKFGNYTRKTLDRFTTKDSYTWNITHNTESTAL